MILGQEGGVRTVVVYVIRCVVGWGEMDYNRS